MALFILSFLGGALTILAPCILPVLPFVFARTGRPFVQSSLPLLAGMALTFAAVGTLGAVAGQWAQQANDAGRYLALAVLALMGLSLLLPQVSARLTRLLVNAGNRLSKPCPLQSCGDGGPRHPAFTSFVLGMATGLLWAPCAGPILGLILTGAVLQGPNTQTSLLLLAFAAGAATSLAVALLIGGRVFEALKRTLGLGENVRRALGAAVLAGVAAVVLGLDTGALAQMSSERGAALEQSLLKWLGPAPLSPNSLAGTTPIASAMLRVQARPELKLPVEGQAPPIAGAVEWLNSPPLTAAQLKGKVVLVDFWTFGCINCRNALPYVKQWHDKYKDQGLVVIGVHSPEFAFEKNIGNVKKAVNALGITFPVAIDNNFTVWRSFNNNYWPAHYFVDAKGRIRFHHFGKGEYEKSEQVIEQLLKEARQAAPTT